MTEGQMLERNNVAGQTFVPGLITPNQQRLHGMHEHAQWPGASWCTVVWHVCMASIDHHLP